MADRDQDIDFRRSRRQCCVTRAHTLACPAAIRSRAAARRSAWRRAASAASARRSAPRRSASSPPACTPLTPPLPDNPNLCSQLLAPLSRRSAAKLIHRIHACDWAYTLAQGRCRLKRTTSPVPLPAPFGLHAVSVPAAAAPLYCLTFFATPSPQHPPHRLAASLPHEALHSPP